MTKIYPLFSSSSGNCTYIGDENNGILIDTGVSCKKICTALNDHGISPEAVQGIFITHTHSDHIQGLKVFTKKYGTPVFAQRTNLEILANADKVSASSRLYEIDGVNAEIGGFLVRAFETPHDTPASCGYRVVTPNDSQCAVCTDLGKVTPAIHSELRYCDVVLLESNYDFDMLKNGSYPFDLKKRISSDHGHLSNDDCGEQLTRLLEVNVNKFILGHLSRENNSPDIAEKSTVDILSKERYIRDVHYQLHIASPDGNGLAVEI